MHPNQFHTPSPIVLKHFSKNPSPDIAIYVKNAKSFTKFALTNFTHKQDHTLKQSTTMNDYDNDYTDDMYDRYMLTGEGAEYFEDFEDITEEDEEVNINQTQTEITETEAPEYVDINKQLDEIIRILKRQLKEKERLLKHQNRKTTQKKKTTQNNRPKQKKKPSTENR